MSVVFAHAVVSPDRSERPAVDESAVGSAASCSPAVELSSLGYAYPGTRHPVVADLDLTVPAGGHLAVVGRSGCGKSTLLSLIAGLEEPTTGTAAVLGDHRPDQRLASCALMPQGDSLLPWLSVLDNVAISLRNQGVNRRDARAAARGMLARVGLAEWARARPAALSGGMRQRAALARALLARKPVLLADEPLASLDAITRAEVQQWLRTSITDTTDTAGPIAHVVTSAAATTPTTPTTPTTLVMVTHDVDEALLLAERVVLLARPEPASPARITATWPGWFGDARPREDLVGDPDFAATRQSILRALAHPGITPPNGEVA